MSFVIKRVFHILKRLICIVRSIYFSSLIDNDGGKIIVTSPFLKIKIIKNKRSKFLLNGTLKIGTWGGGNSPVVISLAEGSSLTIKKDFEIGNGVRIILNSEASLTIGGKQNESASGITADTLILVHKCIEIGSDFVCAWNVFISDSDWHHIEGQHHQADVRIGNHVWIANGSSILKGTTIGSNCIIASHSKVINTIWEDNVLLGGVPAKLLKKNIKWHRDLPV